MSEERLKRIRPCEHGEWNVHALEGTILNEDGHLDRDKVCPGAVRREITVNYEAAIAVFVDLDGQDPLVTTPKLIEAVVNAALGRGDTREDKE